MLAAALWLDTQDSGLGEKFLDAIEVAIEQILAFPYAAQRDDTGLSRKVVSRFPFTIVYEINIARIHVLAVAHHHREQDYWRERAAGEGTQ